MHSQRPPQALPGTHAPGPVDASALPDGCVALVPEDVADLGLYGCQVRDQRVLADVARFAGDVVAALAA